MKIDDAMVQRLGEFLEPYAGRAALELASLELEHYPHPDHALVEGWGRAMDDRDVTAQLEELGDGAEDTAREAWEADVRARAGLIAMLTEGDGVERLCANVLTAEAFHRKNRPADELVAASGILECYHHPTAAREQADDFRRDPDSFLLRLGAKRLRRYCRHLVSYARRSCAGQVVL